MIAIVDYGLGNLGSVSNMLKVIGEKTRITNEKSMIEEADGIILPGVGAFDAGMSKLNETGLTEVIKEEAKKKKPILGICLGMQMLGRSSEEGHLPGLSLISFECRKFSFEDNSLKIPHMGWDVVEFRKQHPILKNLHGQQRYYFVHSYHAVCDHPESILMTCDYGYEFAAAVVEDHIIGVQFHPEKSHDFGLSLLHNFVNFCHGEESCLQGRESFPHY